MKVVVYSTQACSTCAMLKEWLKEHKISFEDVDISKDAKAIDEIIKKTGQMTTPVTEIDGRFISGFDVKKLKEALKIK